MLNVKKKIMMKKLSGIFLFAAVAAMAAGCTRTDENNGGKDPGTDKTTLVRFYADVNQDEETRATLNVDGAKFTGEWESGDALGIIPTVNGDRLGLHKFSYDGDIFAFEGGLSSGDTGTWKYWAFYPHAEIDGTTAKIPFGNFRTQNGNSYNSNYDALVAGVEEHENADPGKTSDGKEITFDLKRLVSILNFNVSGSGADQVKHLLLTAEGGETISAGTIEFDIAEGHGAGVAVTDDPETGTDASNVIAVGFDNGTAPTASDLNAFINVPAGDYTTLTFDVITEDGKIGSATTDRTGKPFVAGKLYKKGITGMTFAPAAAPTLVWEGQDMNAIHEITTDENDQLTYSANISITAQAAIAGLEVEIESDALNGLGLSVIDIFNLSYADRMALGLVGGVDVQYKKEVEFDITPMLPLILLLQPEGGSLHTFKVKVTDLTGQVTQKSLTFMAPYTGPTAIYNKDADLWANTASFNLVNIPDDAQSVSVSYKKSTDASWQTATVVGNTATIAPEWNDNLTAAPANSPNTVLPYSRIKAGTGVFAGNTYDYILTVDGVDYTTRQFTTVAGDVIPGGDFGSNSLPCFTTSGSQTSAFWGSGNNSTTTGLCTANSSIYGKAAYSAKMTSSKAPVISILAAGNLFTANFRMADTYTGEVKFGQKYDWTARPRALRVSYRAKVGVVDRADGAATKIAKNQQDRSRIYFCIVDWGDNQHVVSSTPNVTIIIKVATAKTVGAWDPELTTNPGEGKVIGYGAMWISTTNSSMVTEDIEVNFYDKTAKPTAGKYSLVISCACNAFGDVFNGCSSNELYVDDFEWVY